MNNIAIEAMAHRNREFTYEIWGWFTRLKTSNGRASSLSPSGMLTLRPANLTRPG